MLNRLAQAACVVGRRRRRLRLVRGRGRGPLRVEGPRGGRGVEVAPALEGRDVQQHGRDRIALGHGRAPQEIDPPVVVDVTRLGRRRLHAHLVAARSHGPDPVDLQQATGALQDHIEEAVAVEIGQRSESAVLGAARVGRQERHHELGRTLVPFRCLEGTDGEDHSTCRGRPHGVRRSSRDIDALVAPRYHGSRATGQICAEFRGFPQTRAVRLLVDQGQVRLEIGGRGEGGNRRHRRAAPRRYPMIRGAAGRGRGEKPDRQGERLFCYLRAYDASPARRQDGYPGAR